MLFVNLIAFSVYADSSKYTIGNTNKESQSVQNVENIQKPKYTVPSEYKIDPNKVNVVVNGKEVAFDDVEPMIINDRTMLPFRKIAEELGAEVYYQECPNDVGLITTMRDHTLITMINAEYFHADTIVGGEWRMHKYTLSDDPQDYISIFFEDYEGKSIMNPQPIILNDRTMIPVRLFSEAYGADVNWNEETYTVYIDIPEASHKRSQAEIDADTNYTYQNAISYCHNFLAEQGMTEDEIDAVVIMVNNLYNIKGKLYAFSIEKFTDEYTLLGFYADGSHIAFKK